MRARSSRRADDGSHRVRACNARLLRLDARRRPIADSSAVISSALRAPGGVGPIAPCTRCASRAHAARPARRPRDGRSSSHATFQARAPLEAEPEADADTDTDTDTDTNTDACPYIRHARAG